MSGLQGFIFITGLVALVGIYAHWRWTQGRKARADAEHERREPGWQDDEAWEADSAADGPDEDWEAQTRIGDEVLGIESEPHAIPAAPPRLVPMGSPAASPAPTPSGLNPAPRAPARREAGPAGQVLVFYIIARDAQGFAGAELFRVFRELHLVAGERDIFYRYAENGTQSVYCVANAVEPGRFELSAMDSLRTPGLTVFAVLPGPWPARDILTAMHRAALSLADRLDGEVLDRRRQALTAMGFQALLDELPTEA
jgi:FtsZ-interacting cell division protein ZipA